MTNKIKRSHPHTDMKPVITSGGDSFHDAPWPWDDLTLTVIVFAPPAEACDAKSLVKHAQSNYQFLRQTDSYRDHHLLHEAEWNYVSVEKMSKMNVLQSIVSFFALARVTWVDPLTVLLKCLSFLLISWVKRIQEVTSVLASFPSYHGHTHTLQEKGSEKQLATKCLLFNFVPAPSARCKFTSMQRD